MCNGFVGYLATTNLTTFTHGTHKINPAKTDEVFKVRYRIRIPPHTRISCRCPRVLALHAVRVPYSASKQRVSRVCALARAAASRAQAPDRFLPVAAGFPFTTQTRMHICCERRLLHPHAMPSDVLVATAAAY